VAADVFRRRYQPHDVSVFVVRAGDGLLVADTRSSHRQADEIRWPRTIGQLRAELRDGDVLVPGHGAVVDAAFLAAQHEQLVAAAALIVELHAAGVPAERAEAEAGDRWPFPEGLPSCGFAAAVRDGYRQLTGP
jgi:hypothetical protein